MTDQWEWETQNPRQNELENRNTHQETGSLSSEVIEENIPKGSGLSGLQVSLGDELMDAYNEEEFIQKELNDIREMKRQKMLEQRTPMYEDQKKKSAPKVAKKSVGFAEEVDDEEKKNEPVKGSQYLPENKPKPILKS